MCFATQLLVSKRTKIKERLDNDIYEYYNINNKIINTLNDIIYIINHFLIIIEDIFQFIKSDSVFYGWQNL